MLDEGLFKLIEKIDAEQNEPDPKKVDEDAIAQQVIDSLFPGDKDAKDKAKPQPKKENKSKPEAAKKDDHQPWDDYVFTKAEQKEY